MCWNWTYEGRRRPRFFNVSVPEPRTAKVSFWRSRGTILAIVAVPLTVIAMVYSVLFAGVTSRARPTGSVAGVQNLVSEELRLQGVSPSVIRIRVALSTVDRHWAIFVLTPKPAAPSNLERTYGFTAFRDNRWQVVASGTTQVGCADSSHAASVPAAVLRGFGSVCATQ